MCTLFLLFDRMPGSCYRITTLYLDDDIFAPIADGAQCLMRKTQSNYTSAKIWLTISNHSLCQSFLSYWWPVFKTLLMKSYHEINTLHLFEIYHRLILLNLQWWLIFLCFFYLLSGYFQRRKCQLPCVTAFGK